MERSAALIGGISPVDSCVLHVVICGQGGGRAASYMDAFGDGPLRKSVLLGAAACKGGLVEAGPGA